MVKREYINITSGAGGRIKYGAYALHVVQSHWCQVVLRYGREGGEWPKSAWATHNKTFILTLYLYIHCQPETDTLLFASLKWKTPPIANANSLPQLQPQAHFPAFSQNFIIKLTHLSADAKDVKDVNQLESFFFFQLY